MLGGKTGACSNDEALEKRSHGMLQATNRWDKLRDSRDNRHGLLPGRARVAQRPIPAGEQQGGRPFGHPQLGHPPHHRLAARHFKNLQHPRRQLAQLQHTLQERRARRTGGLCSTTAACRLGCHWKQPLAVAKSGAASTSSRTAAWLLDHADHLAARHKPRKATAEVLLAGAAQTRCSGCSLSLCCKPAARAQGNKARAGPCPEP